MRERAVSIRHARKRMADDAQPPFRNHKTFLRVSFFSAQELATTSRVHSSIAFEEDTMGKGLLLWLLGVPIPVIILLWLFFGR